MPFMPWVLLLLALPFTALAARAIWLARPQRRGPHPVLPVASPGAAVGADEYESCVRDDRATATGPSSRERDLPGAVALVLNAASCAGGAVLSVYAWPAVIEGATAGWATWPGVAVMYGGLVIVPAQFVLFLVSLVLSSWATPTGRRVVIATAPVGLALPVVTAAVARAVVVLY
jgi:hypothetical protein